ncbi:phosphotransferase enzyme family protein [Gracilibacillus alcaliphilus]|uniref:phosphotransferase enzyme family protein n=1 Tax=Gracilibacillus alcaliphilus TaxID=1401441 RepID=UPI00195CF8BF|nr:phosphotransferase [Gracilibacillus alcaliphilus]MBM7677845.1 Ser/Thr protein kinase RdoA (MazF antagonist) [Gracilibacillus alcaliphilus]
MEKSLLARFTKKVIAEAASRYGVQFEELHLLGKHQNLVYGYLREGREYILRITHASHRSQNLIQGELDWINYLSKNDLHVSTPIYSDKGNLIETYVSDTNDCFFMVAFEKALGAPLQDTISQEEDFKYLGIVTGRLHSLTKNYLSTSEKTRRFTWNENEYLKKFTDHIPQSQERVLSYLDQLMERLDELPKDQAAYGLIHGDLLFGNYFIQKDGTITLFDFDECQYGWFMQDIAVNLFYGVVVPFQNENEITFARRYLTYFFEGYDKENTLDRKLLEQLPLFLELRQVILYSSLYRNGNLASLDSWSQTFLEKARRNMEHSLPIIDMQKVNL